MDSGYIGPLQVAILDRMHHGQPLYQEHGRWFYLDGQRRRYLNRERCMGLFLRGFIMATGADSPLAYGLTEKGKRR